MSGADAANDAHDADGTPSASTPRVDRDAATGVDRWRLVLWSVTVLLAVGLLLFATRVVGVLIVGLFVYYVTRPVFGRVRTRIGSRTVAAAVTLLAIGLPTLLLLAWTVVVLVEAVGEFLDSPLGDRLVAAVDPYVDLPDVGPANVDEALRAVAADPRRVAAEVGPLVTGLFDGLLVAGTTLGSVGLQAFIVLVIAFYLLRDDVRVAAWARHALDVEGSVVETYLVRVDRDLERVYFGNMLNALATGLIAVVTFHVLNAVAPPAVDIPQPTLVGLLVGVASLVPAVGIKLVTWPLGVFLLASAALADPTALWFPVVFLVVSFVVVDYVPDQLLRPYVSGRSLHVGAIMLAYLFGPLLFGWYGIFLGPFLLVVVLEFARIVLPWLTGADAAAVDADATGDAAGTGPVGTGTDGDDATDDDTPPDRDAPPDRDRERPRVDRDAPATDRSPAGADEGS